MYLHTFLDTYPHLIDPFKKKMGHAYIDSIMDKGDNFRYKTGFSVFVDGNSWVPEEGEDFIIHKARDEKSNIVTINLLQPYEKD